MGQFEWSFTKQQHIKKKQFKKLKLISVRLSCHNTTHSNYLFCFKITMRKSLLSIFLVFSNPSFAFVYQVSSRTKENKISILSSADNCMKLCQFVGNCENWTYLPRDKMCFLKKKDCSLRFARGLYSGQKNGGSIMTNVDCYGGDFPSKDGGHCRLPVKTPHA